MPYIPKKDRPKHDVQINLILWACETKKGLLDLLTYHKNNEDSPISKLALLITSTGDLNYSISRIIWSLFYRNRRYTYGEELMGALIESQAYVNEDIYPIDNFPLAQLILALVESCKVTVKKRAVWTLECVKLEYYTRHLRKYEDEKIMTPTNGDVNYEWPTRRKK